MTELTFLGITLNSERFEARLPDDKLADIKQLVLDASSTRSIPAAKFVSLLGKLSFAAQVIVSGRTFMRRLWDTAKKFSKVPRHYRITLSSDCRKDLLWWQEFLASWNGKWFFLYQPETSSTDLDLLQVYSDAGGTIGWGAYYANEGRWMHSRWEQDTIDLSIEYKELFPILVACATWGHMWCRFRIAFHCDNQAVVDCLASGTSKSPPVMALIRKLFFVCARHNFCVVVRHVLGKSNAIADALSRLKMQEFRMIAPRGSTGPDTTVPLPSWD
ncbi:uncharacterized protein LOC135827068 [Sycon ciliatum]|uniref:uncharacterized protein LOC135827068 n=1 Tax=Sycon ciliatum TaxID=27933 RepID=UPI0031F5F915